MPDITAGGCTHSPEESGHYLCPARIYYVGDCFIIYLTQESQSVIPAYLRGGMQKGADRSGLPFLSNSDRCSNGFLL